MGQSKIIFLLGGHAIFLYNLVKIVTALSIYSTHIYHICLLKFGKGWH